MKFLSATYANGERTVCVAETDTNGAVVVSTADTPAEWAALLASGIPIADYAAPPLPPYILSKFDFIGRMTDDEAGLFDAALAASPVKERLAFQNAASLDSSAPLFAVFAGRVSDLFGKDRAAELLAAP
jgi:hypothetical protein